MDKQSERPEAGKSVSVVGKMLSDFPEIAAQWHPTKNGDLRPEEVAGGSDTIIWWKCPEGMDHEWEAPAVRRTNQGAGCPSCAGRKASSTNSLAALYPAIAAQWHPTKNGPVKPQDVVAGSNKKAWWKCPEGPDHEWEAKLVSRTSRGTGCPVCAGRQVSPTNSLAALHPAISAQWHPTKNGELKPEEVVAGSHQKAWWQCPKEPDHEWVASVVSRTRLRTDCLMCAGRNVSSSNSLASLYPEIAAQWHPTRNGDLTPADIVAGSNTKVWWKCTEGHDHEWETTVAHRTSGGTRCPACIGQQISSTNSLKALYPAIAAQWHPTKNGKLCPEDVTGGSQRKAWWKCPEGEDHEWEASVVNRTRKGSGCAACAGRQVSSTNSLSTRHPAIAAQWHPTKNGKLRPEDVAAGSHRKAWWKCPKGPDHEWHATVANRTFGGRGCPACAGQNVSSTNSLSSLYPLIAAEWHPTKNGAMTPADVVARSNKKVWWKCRAGPEHEWESKVSHRTRQGSGCPRCNKGWTVSAVRAFVRSLLPHIPALTPAERYAIFQQSGLLDATGKSKGFVRAVCTGRFPEDELRSFADGQPSLADDFLADDTVTLEGLDAESIDETSIDDVATPATDDTAAENNALPVVQARDALAVLDHHLVATADEEAAAFLVASARGKLWAHAFRDETAAVAQARAHDGGPYAQEVRDSFLAEYEAARSLPIPAGYAFMVGGRSAQPNLMQRLVAVRVRDQRRYGNWSGTGAGKTLSAVLATRVAGARLTVICCPNAVVRGWASAIRAIYPDSEVLEKTWRPEWATSRPRYLVMNYESFQQPGSEGELKAFLERERVDFVVIDEIHYAKQREVEQMSQRKRLVMALVTVAGEASADLCVLGMSATPVINNLQEGRSLVELVTGLEHEELDTKPTIPNCMRLYQRLVTLGTRWMPAYKAQLEEVREPVDCEELVPQIRALGRKGSPLALEQLLTEARLPVILANIRPKTLIYTLYVEGIVQTLYDAITAKGWKVGLYTGEDKTGLDGFIDGDLDVLIGSSSVGTGVDGLQHVSNRLIVNVLPWTAAEYEQLLGRVWRQGQARDKVTVVVPVTFAEVNGQRWSWCESKLARLQYKKSIADAAVDGVVPEGHLRSPTEAYGDAMKWLERLDTGVVAEIVRRPIVVPLSDSDPADVKRRQARYGDFSIINARWNQAGSEKTHARLAANPEEWEQYHTLYRKARESWTIVPFEEMTAWARRRAGKVIGDFGCGEGLFGKAVADRHLVHSFDHVAIDERVIACDLAHVPLEDGTLDIAVFCLSLMGANFADYLREAHRTLKIDGGLHIWEATSRFDDPERFARDLRKIGFAVVEVEQRGPFTHIEAVRRDVAPSTATLSFRVSPS